MFCMIVGVVKEGSSQKTSACANGLKTLNINEPAATNTGKLVI